MLDFQIKQTPFRFGLAEGDDPHAVPFGVLTRLENYVWKKTNRVEKRLGTEWLGSSKAGGGNLSAAVRLFSRGKELCLLDGDKLFSYSTTLGTWSLVDRVPAAGLTWAPLVDTTDGVAGSDTFVSGDFVVTAWTEGDPTNITSTGGELWIQVARLSGEGMYLAPLSLGGTHQGVRVLVIGTTALFIVNTTATGNIYAYSLDLTTFAAPGAPTVLRADRIVANRQNWDANVIDGSTDFVLAYQPAAGGVMRLDRFTSALAAVANSTVALAGVVCQAVSVCATEGESVYVVFQDTNTGIIHLYVADPATMVQVGATINLAVGFAANPARVGVCRYSSTQCAAVYTGLVAAVVVNITESMIVSNVPAIVANTTRFTYGTEIVSNPFMLGTKCYVFVSNYPYFYYGVVDAFLGSQCALLEIFDGDTGGGQHMYVGNVDPLVSGTTRLRDPIPRFRAASTEEMLRSLPVIGTIPNNKYIWRCGLRQIRVTIGASVPKDLWRSTLSGIESHFCCGTLTVYDGTMIFDYGFPRAPVIYNLPSAGAGGMVAGQYLYAVVLEFRGAANVLYRSPVGTIATPVTVLAFPNNLVTVRVENANVGNKKHVGTERYPTQVATYRSVVEGSFVQRLTVEPAANVLAVDYTQPLQDLADPNADADILNAAGPFILPLSARPAVYTGGGELNDQAPPAEVTMFAHVDRLFVLDGGELTWWYSKRFTDNVGVAPGFNTAFRVILTRKQVAGASMDDKAIFFSNEGIDYMLGLGPAKDGTSNDFSTPVRIQTDVGCKNARSVVSCPDGVMFESVRGIYLLTRNLELVWIGRPIQDTLVLFPNITSATLVAHRNEIRFTANNGDGTEGVVMVYNYVEKQWSTSRYYDGVADFYGCPIADSCMWNGAWTFTTPSGSVYKEVTTHHFDDTDTYADGVIETAWNSAAGPIAYHAVRNFWIQGVSHSNHDLTIEIGFDSNNTYQQIRPFPSLSRVTAVGDLEEAKISVGKRRKCNSIRFKITDSKPTTFNSAPGNGKGPAFATMGYEVGVKKGDNTPKAKKG